MAQLTAPQQARLDEELSHALREWGRLPQVEAAFADWPEDEAITFVYEWSLEEERLRRLAEHAGRGELTRDQQARYRQLMAIVDHHRPIVERLIES